MLVQKGKNVEKEEKIKRESMAENLCVLHIKAVIYIEIELNHNKYKY